jgi:hypothetical protein
MYIPIPCVLQYYTVYIVDTYSLSLYIYLVVVVQNIQEKYQNCNSNFSETPVKCLHNLLLYLTNTPNMMATGAL